ncbi:fungal specific transcription factor [Sarocladium implicatum]|nr:fungal specific transcription factor [Sarocladium implicatum]
MRMTNARSSRGVCNDADEEDSGVRKRCYHGEEQPETRYPEPEPSAEGETEADGIEQQDEQSTREQSFSPGRVSEYNPQAVLADLSKPLGHEGLAIGTDHTSTPYPTASPNLGSDSHATSEGHVMSTDKQTQRRILWYNRHKRRARQPKLSDNYRRYLQDEDAFLKLPRTTTDALLPMYTSLLDDLIPLIDGARVFREYSNGQSSIYLVRAMCMVVCKTRQAAPFLRLSEGGPVLAPLKFADHLLQGLEAAIKADLEPDRLTKIQILALMHLHNDGVGGTDRASNHLAQAISAAWSLSIHWHVPGIEDQEQCRLLWWSLRSLDRLNKPVMGAAPFLIDDADVALDRPQCRSDSYRSQVMAMSLTLGDLMKRATKVYKASFRERTDDMGEFPTLDELTRGTSFVSFHRSHRGYLEIWYHVTAMLSCRYSGPGSKPYIRRLVSADRILEIVSKGGHEALPPLPLVPYAMSMSTTMIYRAFRDGQRDLKRALQDMELCCGALDALSRNWTSAKGVARLARRLWRLLSSSEKGQTKDVAAMPPPTPHTIRDAESNSVMSSSPAPITRQGTAMSSTTAMTPSQVYPDPHSFDGQLPQAWGSGTSYTQLDTAFHDLFDYGMPNVFRDPTTWEFLHVANEDGSPNGSDFLGASSYGSAEPDFGYSYLPMGNS